MGKWFLKFILFSVLVATLAVLNSYYVQYSTKELIYENTKEIPQKKAALVLGTAKYVVGGGKNYFYTYRIRAALELWRAGKVRAIVVSGDGGSKYYDEATTMFDDLVAEGVPSQYITKDYAGFKTLDSIIRAKEIFGLEDYIVVSQRFHLERALRIAKAKGQKAIGYTAKDIAGTKAAYRMQFREYLARAANFLQVHVLHTKPRFLGKKEKVKYK